MFHYHRFCTLLLFICSLMLLPGCGQQGPPVNPVGGIVTLDGQPVANASISFTPVQGSGSGDMSDPLVSGGNTDADGKYTLTAVRGGVIGGGTTVGKYNVTIIKKELLNAPSGPGQQMVGRPRFHYVVPQVFESESTSNVQVEVVKGKNVFNFALTSTGTCEITQQ